jgi:hypothetical protein
MKLSGLVSEQFKFISGYSVLGHFGMAKPRKLALGLFMLSTAIVTTAIVTGGCVTTDSGREPPADELYFPTGLALSGGRKSLYVANSDFDLQYKAGTVMQLDAEKLIKDVRRVAAILENEDPDESFAEACGSIGLEVNPEVLLQPGPCAPFPTDRYVRKSVEIGAFASDLYWLGRPDGEGARLLIPVRGDPSITQVDVADDRPGAGAEAEEAARRSGACGTATACLACDVDRAGGCGESSRIGRDPGVRDGSPDPRPALPVEPMALAWSADAKWVISTHQSSASVALTSHAWTRRLGSDDSSAASAVESVLDKMPPGPTGVTRIPGPAVAVLADASTEAKAAAKSAGMRPGFLVGYRAAPALSLLRIEPSVEKQLGFAEPPQLEVEATIPLTLTASGADSRGILVSSRERRQCEAACIGMDTPTEIAADALEAEFDAAVLARLAQFDLSPTGLACLEDCAQVPLDVVVANRAPASLLLGRITTETRLPQQDGVARGWSDQVEFQRSVALGAGPSRVVEAFIVTDAGNLERRLLIACFDARSIFVYDPVAERVEATIRTGRGPHALVGVSGTTPDGPYAYLVVGHFTDSYLGVVNLDARSARSFATMIATVGKRTPPREAQ